jgi:hypothetical protein
MATMRIGRCKYHGRHRMVAVFTSAYTHGRHRMVAVFTSVYTHGRHRMVAVFSSSLRMGAIGWWLYFHLPTLMAAYRQV